MFSKEKTNMKFFHLQLKKISAEYIYTRDIQHENL